MSTNFNVNITLIFSGAFYNNPITDVYYEGTEEEWNAIEIDNEDYGYGNNDALLNATIHFNTPM